MNRLQISFGIKTHLQREAKTVMTIYSILAQNIPDDDFEIVVTGKCDFKSLDSSVLSRIKLVEDKEAADRGLLGRMLNNLARNATFETLCLMDDDIILTDGWYERVKANVRGQSNCDVFSFPIKNVDGSRFWDCAYVDAVCDYSRLVPMGTAENHVYVTGGMVLLGKSVWNQVKWDSDREFYKREDVDWSERVKKNGFKIGHCQSAFVLHNDWRYSQKGDRVFRAPEKIPPIDRPWPQIVEEALWRTPDADLALRSFLSSSVDNPFPLPANAHAEVDAFNDDKYQEETIVVWLGRFSRNVGYAIAAKNYLHAMSVAGQKAIAFDLETMKAVGPSPGIGLEIRSVGGGLRISCDNPKANFVAVVHEIPTEYERVTFAGRVRRVAYFVFETSSIPGTWLRNVKNFDEVWTASTFNRQTFIEAGIPADKIKIIPHCLDMSDYSEHGQKLKIPDSKKFKFLTVASNFNRKDLGMLLRSYFRTFKKSDQVSLIVKLPRQTDRKLWEQFVVAPLQPEFDLNSEDLAHVVFLRANLSHDRMVAMYRSCDVYVSVERGKGWDLPAMEAMALGKPAIGIDWGGSVDFMSADRSYLLKPEGLTQVDPTMVTGLDLYAGHYWAKVSDGEMERCLLDAFQSEEVRTVKGRLSRAHIAKNFDLQTVGQMVKTRAQNASFGDRHGAPALLVCRSEESTDSTELRREIEKIKSSLSWKLGNFLVRNMKRLTRFIRPKSRGIRGQVRVIAT